MSIREKLMADLKEAMKSRDQLRLDTIRFIQSAIKNREIDLRPQAIDEPEVLAVLKKMAKQRKESIDQYRSAGRQDLVDKEQAELVILEEYLPQAMDQGQVEAIVGEVIAALGATEIKQMGAVIKEVQARTAGAADNRMISELVKAKLSPQ